jgi:hypothetical protein
LITERLNAGVTLDAQHGWVGWQGQRPRRGLYDDRLTAEALDKLPEIPCPLRLLQRPGVDPCQAGVSAGQKLGAAWLGVSEGLQRRRGAAFVDTSPPRREVADGAFANAKAGGYRTGAKAFRAPQLRGPHCEDLSPQLPGERAGFLGHGLSPFRPPA